MAAAAAQRPASAGAAIPSKHGGSIGGGSAASSPRKQAAPGDVRAVQGLTIAAEYSVPGSTQHNKPRKWLKFKGGSTAGSSSGSGGGGGREDVQHSGHGGHSTEELDGCAPRGGWGGIFAFRRSVDGAKH